MNKILGKENYSLIGLFLFFIPVVYFSPFIVNRLVFLGLLFYAYRNKQNYFWIALLFILLDPPGSLFFGGASDDLKRLPFYGFSKVSLGFIEIYIGLLFLKASQINFKSPFVFRETRNLIIIIAAYLMALSFAIGQSGSAFIVTIRLLFPWILMFSIPYLLKNNDDFDRFNKLIFPFVFIALVSQFYTLLNGIDLNGMLKGNITTNTVGLKLSELEEGDVLRVADSSLILLYSTTMAFIYLIKGNSTFPKAYLTLIITVSTISVFISATRGWILGYLLFYFLIFISFSKGKNYLIRLVIVSIGVLILTYLIIPKVQTQIDGAYDRFSTITYLAKGDITAAGTDQRLSTRAPRVMNEFYERPLIGWGFTDRYYEFQDPHVGNQNMLLNMGVFVYIIFIMVFLYMVYRIYNTPINFYPDKLKVKYLRVISFTLIAMFLIHSSSGQGWGFQIGAGHILLYTLLLSFYSATLNERV